MRSPTSASARLPDATLRANERNGTAAATSVSLPRLYFLRLGYLVIRWTRSDEVAVDHQP
jgi:hypothetical protein